MAIYIEESFFRPIHALRPQATNRALFIPAANDAGHTIAQLAARALAWPSVSIGTLRAVVAAVSTAQPDPLSDKRVRRAADGWSYPIPVKGSQGTIARPATLGPAQSHPRSSAISRQRKGGLSAIRITNAPRVLPKHHAAFSVEP